jgi:phage tail-like protein
VTELAPYRQFLLLGPLPGWRASATALTEDAHGAYRLDALPGAAQPLALPDAAAPCAPVAIAVSARRGCEARHDQRIVVLDASDQRVELIDTAGERPRHTLPGIGGRGRDARHFRRAQDIALLEHRALAIADAGHRQVKIFSAYPHALLGVWGSLGAPTRLAAGIDGLLWVLDSDGARVFSLDRDGRQRTTLAGITAPAAVAANAYGKIAVLDGNDVKVFAQAAASSVSLGQVPAAASITFGPGGFVYVGTMTGLIYSFAPHADGTWRAVGVGVLGEAAAINRLIWQGGTTLLALVRPPDAHASQLWRIDTGAAFVTQGTLSSDELNSGLAGCVWHRIALDADLPAGTAIEVRTGAYDTSGGSAVPDLVPAPIVLAAGNIDCLVQGGPGQYLKLTLTLRGNGSATPVLRGIRVWYPRKSWLQFLPAIFQEDDESASFLSRFLSILQTNFDDFDETIDNIAALFDPLSVPDKWYAWLAAWLALPIEPTWTDAQRRAVLKGAYRNYQRRGTAAGLEQLVADYAGVGARLVEHFRLRQLIVLSDDLSRAVTTDAGRLWSRDFYRRLQLGVYSQVGMFKLVGEPEPGIEPVAWGASEFSVFFDAEPATVEVTRKKVAAVVEREKPAHTMATYRPVYPRMRLGVQATLGVDTRVGEVGQAVLGSISTLGYDAVLAPSELELGMRAIGASVRSRLGVDTRLV